jgi:hypothetical protein
MRRRRLLSLAGVIILLTLTVLGGRRTANDVSDRPDLRPPLRRGNPTIPYTKRGQLATRVMELSKVAAS